MKDRIMLTPESLIRAGEQEMQRQWDEQQRRRELAYDLYRDGGRVRNKVEGFL